MKFTTLLVVAAAVALGCGDDDVGDGGGRDMATGDGGGRDMATTGDGGGRDMATTGDGGCVPTIELCGDRMDQNCDGRDQSCGDNDSDGIEACRTGDDLTMCDCDDTRADVRPPFGSVAGAPELCDGVDNNCNGRVDEASACCAGCADIDPTRADICLEGSGACDCSTEPGEGPCASGQTCCANGCTDTETDFDNCGRCNSMCTNQADRCTAGDCACGSTPPCSFDRMCSAGSC